uniref:Transmembrane protein 106 C-terminal domain-containing protein n=1 Tax=Sinocyclocheilus rhinocerous TaxID=307959 RepID=A0A673KP03_9TELE
MGASVCRHGRSLLPRHSRPGHKGSLMGGDDSLDGLDRQEDIHHLSYLPGVRTHPIRTSVKTSYMVRAAQNTLEAYRYIDCGANSTIHQPSGLVWSKPHFPQNGKLLR